MSLWPKKALVLAAGLGTRLRPLTFGCPKPMLPLWNVPLLERVLAQLESWGVEEIAVNLHWRPEAVERHLASRGGKARVRVSFEPEILGTGGALRPVRDFLSDAPFWMVNADIVASLKPDDLVGAFSSGGGLASAWLEPKKGPRTVEADRKGRITCFRSPTPGVPGTFTFCGVQVVSPRVFEFLPESGFCTIVEAYEGAMRQGLLVDGVVVKGSYWNDAGTPEAYLQIHRDLQDGATGNADGKRGQNAFFCVSGEASVAPDVTGSMSVVYGESEVLGGSELKRCIIGGGRVGGKLSGVVCVDASEVEDEVCPDAVRALGWQPRKTAAAFLGARGSDRSFWRLYHGEESAIYVGYSLDRPENGRYAGHARLLKEAGLPVPVVKADSPERRFLVMEDWGDCSLQEKMRSRSDAALSLYRPVVAALAALHTRGTLQAEASGIELERPFDEDLYGWEHALFTEQLLQKRFGYEGLPEDVSAELREVSRRLMTSRQVLVHRDFQSSNILFRGKEFAFIDFQGMRLGSAAYDLASLLCDPYVKISSNSREELLAEYSRCCPVGGEEAVGLFSEGAVQRLVQTLGAFGRLASVGQTGFAQYILPALERLLEVSDMCGCGAIGGLSEDLIAREISRQGC